MFGGSLINPSPMVKEGGSNANEIYNFDGDGTGLINFKPYVAYTVNPNPQVGVFSKGNIVNVIRFEGNNAIIENPNFVEPDLNAPKVGFFGNLGEKFKKEFSIPKDYLQKVDDSTSITIQTGINYGANPKPQSPVKPIPFNPITQTILEENASFVLSRDFQYVSHYGSSYCSPDGLCTADMSPKFSTLKAGTKVTGRLFRETNNTLYKLQAGAIAPPPYNDYLAVKGYGDKGSINIPLDYLTKEVPINSGVVVPAKNDNKNLLMIVGAFLVGYVVFSKGKSE
jgi:hypothetical protein